MRIGTPVSCKVGVNPPIKGRVAGVKIVKSNGEFIPVNVSIDPKKKDVRNYRVAYLTVLGVDGKPLKAGEKAAKPTSAPAVKKPAGKK